MAISIALLVLLGFSVLLVILLVRNVLTARREAWAKAADQADRAIERIAVPEFYKEKWKQEKQKELFWGVFWKHLKELAARKSAISGVLGLLKYAILIIPAGALTFVIWDAFNSEPVHVVLTRPDPTVEEQRYSFLGLKPLSAEDEARIQQSQGALPQDLPSCPAESVAYFPSAEPFAQRTHYCYWRYRVSSVAESPTGDLYFARGAWVTAEIYNQNFTAPVYIKDIKLVFFEPSSPDPNLQLDRFRYDWPPQITTARLDAEKPHVEAPTFGVAIVRTASGQYAGFVEWTALSGDIDYESKFEYFSPGAADDNAQGILSLLSLHHGDYWQDKTLELTIQPGQRLVIEGKIWLQVPAAVHLGLLVEYEEKGGGEVPRWLWRVWRFLVEKGLSLHPVCDPICRTAPSDRANSINIVYNPAMEVQATGEFQIVYVIGDVALSESAGQLDSDSSHVFVAQKPSSPALVAGPVHIFIPPELPGWSPYASQIVVDALYAGQRIDPFLDMPPNLRELYNIDPWLVDLDFVPDPDLQIILDRMEISLQ